MRAKGEALNSWVAPVSFSVILQPPGTSSVFLVNPVKSQASGSGPWGSVLRVDPQGNATKRTDDEYENHDRGVPILASILVTAGLLSELRKTEAQAMGQPRGGLGFSGTVVPGLGLRVNYVFPFSPAQRIGLESGDVVLLINGSRIDSMVAYARILASSGGFVDLIVRNVRTGAPLLIPRVPLEPPAFDALRREGHSANPVRSDTQRGRTKVFTQSR